MNQPEDSGNRQLRKFSVGGLLGRVADLFLGYDFFISYSHRDGPKYVADLHQRLQALGYRVFLDTREYMPGDELNAATKRRVRMSKYLLLVARPHALDSKWVRKEIEACLSAGRTPILIDVNGQFEQAPPSPLKALLEDRLRITEVLPSPEAEPSESTLQQLARSFRGARQETFRLRLVAGVACAFAVVAGVAIWQYFLAEDRRKTAVARQLAIRAQLLALENSRNLDLPVLLAIESMVRRPTLEGDQILRQFSGLLPPLVCKLEHSGTVEAIAFSHDGKRLATTCHDGQLRLWDAANGQLIRALALKKAGPVVFTPDGQFILAAEKGALRKWKVGDGAEVAHVILSEQQENPPLQFSPDSRYLVSAGKGETAQFWDTASGRRVEAFEHAPVPLPFFDISEGSDFIVQHSMEIKSPDDENQLLEVRKFPGGEKVASVKCATLALALRVSPDGSYVLYTDMEGNVRVVRVADATEVARMHHPYVLSRLWMSGGGRCVGSIDGDGTARVWTGANGAEIFRRTSIGEPFHGHFHDDVFAFNADGTRFATATLEEVDPPPSGQVVRAGDIKFRSTVYVWNSDVSDRSGFEHAGKVHGHPFDSAGKRMALAVALKDHIVRVVDVESGQTIATMTHEMRVPGCALSADGNLLATACWDGNARVFALPSGKETATLQHGDRVSSVAWSAQSQMLATSSDDKTVRVWHLPEGKAVFSTNLPEAVRCAAIDNPGVRVATAGPGNQVRVFDVASGRQISALEYPGRPEYADFSPDGRFLAGWSRGRDVVIWDARSGKVCSRVAHDEGVNAAAFSPDSKFLATGSQDGTCRVWACTSGEELLRLVFGHVGAVAFTSDQKSLLANVNTEGPGAIVGGVLVKRIWQRDDVVRNAARRLLRDLTPEEWVKFVGPDEPYRRTITGK